MKNKAMTEKEAWDRYGIFYERRARAAELAEEAAVRRRPRWKKAAGWAAGFLFGMAAWYAFIWAGTRLWPH